MRETRFVKTIGICLLAGFVCAAAARAVDYYVAVDGNDANDGLTLATAKRTVQAAINAAAAGDTVLVNDGVYKLTATIEIKKGLTVRSINGRVAAILDGQGALRCVELDHAAARLEGFTVRRGLADEDSCLPFGGGILNEQGVVKDCLITDNYAESGGGVINGSDGHLIDCAIVDNRAWEIAAGVWNEGLMSNCQVVANYIEGPGYAAGVFNAADGIVQNCMIVSNASSQGIGITFFAGGIFNAGGIVRDCQVSYNTAVFAGGVYNGQGGLVENCLIEYNNADTAGGIWNEDDSLLLNCIVRYNSAVPLMGMGDGSAGGIYNDFDGVVRNCLVVGNQALTAGGVLSDGILDNCTIVGNKALVMVGGLANFDTAFNSIVWHNDAPVFPDILADAMAGDINYSCLPVAVAGVGNITNNPCLFDQGSGFGTNHVYGDYRLTAASPCVDVAWTADWMLEPGAVDLIGNPRIMYTAPDIGAYEYFASPSMLTASEGLYFDQVALVWDEPDPAPAYYAVWRAEVDDVSQATWLADVTALMYNDTSIVPGVSYYYWVSSVIVGRGVFSPAAVGWGAIRPPSGLTASDGLYTDVVRLEWDAASGAVIYRLYRGVSMDFSAAHEIAESSETTWIDDDAHPGILYYYWVRAIGANAIPTPPGNPDAGWRRSMASTHNAHGDFDGDGIMDLVIYNPRTGHWGIMLSAGGYKVASLQLGGPGYIPVPADYCGDGRTDPAVYRENNGEWAIFLRDGDFWRLETRYFGGMGWQPVPGDYDGDGRTDPTVYHRDTGQWRALLSGSGYTEFGMNFGGTGWLPAPADYDGDGRTDPAVYDEATGDWAVMLSSHDYTVVRTAFGGTGWRPVPADYDGDGRADPAVYHGATGEWSALFSSAGYAVQSAMFGGGDWWPVPADYDGDGKADLAVYNLVTGEWSAMLSGSGYTVRGAMFGGTGWLPGAFY